MNPAKRLFISFILTILISPIFGQDSYAYDGYRHDFYNMVNTYYLKKDTNLVKETISFLNDPNVCYNIEKPHLTGFFGALFSLNTKIKNDFSSTIEEITNTDFKRLFVYLLVTNIDSIESKWLLSTEYNDMNWSAYFATGDMKYINLLISNMKYDTVRTDKMLFFTGASAKWSLCSNSQQHKEIMAYLIKVQRTNKLISEILIKPPSEIEDSIFAIDKRQRANGIWK